MKLFIIRITVVFVIVFCIANAVSFISLIQLKNTVFYKPSFVYNKLQNKSLDYIIIGSSTGLTTLNTILIDSLTGYKGYNLSMDDTSISSQYLMLKHFIESGNKTRICILAPAVNSYNSLGEVISDNDYRFLPFINEEYVNKHFKEINDTNIKKNIITLSNWFPIIGVSYYNAELFFPSIYSFVYPEKRNRFDNKGNYSYPVLKKKDRKNKEKKLSKVIFKNSYIKKISDLCKQNNIVLYNYISPLMDKKIEIENKEYIIINHSAVIKNSDNFYDRIHVNKEGRKETSLLLANFFIYSKSFNE